MSPDPIFPSPLMDDDPDTQLEIQTWRLDSLRVVRLLGELDTLTTPRVRVQLDEVLLTFDALTLIMDLTRLTFMGSTGINVLLETRDRVAERSGRLIVVLAPESNPRRLFEVTRMTDHFEVAENLEDTVRVLRQQGPDQAAWGVADEMS
ncbi:STAS domain-containing protein [Streptosporangium sp. 'caverna']|uniref:STAS domain-containing protein n=1 Tax=Streptosporangium sp. 'caverna' TaxID=2202249 RepID=UPI0013A6A934|nr:STAS domain-containing protein [Streptosporangium sp. 'caverna']